MLVSGPKSSETGSVFLRVAFRLIDIVVNCHNCRQMSKKGSTIGAFKQHFLGYEWTFAVVR